jgi:hypothetical protein
MVVLWVGLAKTPFSANFKHRSQAFLPLAYSSNSMAQNNPFSFIILLI